MVTTPAMLGDLIKRLAIGRAELDVIAEVGDRRALKRRLHELHPRPRGHRTAPFRNSRYGHRAVGIAAEDQVYSNFGQRTVAGYELQLRRTPLSDLSPDALVQFIKSDKEDAAPQ